jgi:hypothetical protein
VGTIQNNDTQANELIQSYINALANLVAMERAKNVAIESEAGVLSNLSNLGASNGVFTTPDDIPQNMAENVVKASVNAHLTRVQSQQIAQAAHYEITQSEANIKNTYLSKKIMVQLKDKNADIVDAVLVDNQTGEYRVTKYNATKIKGTIQDVSLENNLLVIKPTKMASLITPNRIFIHVYVIDMQTMTPNISLEIL